MITGGKIIRSLTAAMPGWLLAICAVCLIIPLVRLAALLVVAVPCLIQPVRVRRATSAWKGGKSHRALDRGSEGPTAYKRGVTASIPVTPTQARSYVDL